jgi:hypothetical protein
MDAKTLFRYPHSLFARPSNQPAGNLTKNMDGAFNRRGNRLYPVTTENPAACGVFLQQFSPGAILVA